MSKSVSASFNTQKDSWQNRPFYNIEIDGEIWGITTASSSGTNIYLAQSASPNDADYVGHSLTIGGVAKTILTYTGSTRLATVGSSYSGSVVSVLYTVTNTYRFTSWEKDITAGGNTYTAIGLKVGQVSENATGKIDAPDIYMDNHSNTFTGYANAYWGFRNNKLRVYTLFRDLISVDPTDILLNRYEIRNCEFDEEIGGAKIRCESAVFRAIDMPYDGRRYMREACYWIYRDSATCKYTGSAVPGPNGEADYCSKVFHGNYGCKFGLRITGAFRRNTTNYGGFPAIPDRRAVIFIPSKGA